jgi:hypothetical protein
LTPVFYKFWHFSTAILIYNMHYLSRSFLNLLNVFDTIFILTMRALL